MGKKICFSLTVTFFILSAITYPHANWAAEGPTGALTKFHPSAIDPSAGIDSLLQQVIVHTILQEYKEALALTDSVIRLIPNEPAGYFFRAAVLQSRILDYETFEDEKPFFKASTTCRKLAQKKLSQRNDEAWAHFFIGSALGYEAFYLGKKRRYFEAFRTGWQSIQHLEAALRFDPQLYDVYLGIGTYKYYRSKLSKNFKWLPFVKDERETGILMVREALAKGRYSRAAALNGLSWILMDENRNEEALALADSALRLYPGSRFFLWGAGEAAFRVGRYEQASACYRQILQSLQNENRLSPYLELVARTRLAKVCQAADKMDEACRELKRVSEIELSKDDRERGEEYLRAAERYRKNCQATLTGVHRGP
ncbi:MAG: hypothetical protein ONB44_21105 [candidate division KSB1 bacterium]|nr:hypothetical protein [candidate division KSB1 bacterium]MDZ7304633.1 hypothetical protein [candidate division KSB1 bacterium]MDZ7313765.1 hypothetical protein [candidate division KSB1 bacterium]